MRPCITACVLLTALGAAPAHAQQYQFGEYYGRHDFSNGFMPTYAPVPSPGPFGYNQYSYPAFQTPQPGYGYQPGYVAQPVYPAVGGAAYPYPQTQFTPSSAMPNVGAAASAPAHQHNAPQTNQPQSGTKPAQIGKAQPINNNGLNRTAAPAGKTQPIANKAVNGVTAPAGKTGPATKVGAEQKISVNPNGPRTGAPAPGTTGIGAGRTQPTSDEFELSPIRERAVQPQPTSTSQLPEPKW